MGPSCENLFMAKSVNSSGIKVIMSGLRGDEFHGGYYYRYDFCETCEPSLKVRSVY